METFQAVDAVKIYRDVVSSSCEEIGILKDNFEAAARKPARARKDEPYFHGSVVAVEASAF